MVPLFDDIFMNSIVKKNLVVHNRLLMWSDPSSWSSSPCRTPPLCWCPMSPRSLRYCPRRSVKGRVLLLLLCPPHGSSSSGTSSSSWSRTWLSPSLRSSRVHSPLHLPWDFFLMNTVVLPNLRGYTSLTEVIPILPNTHTIV